MKNWKCNSNRRSRNKQTTTKMTIRLVGLNIISREVHLPTSSEERPKSLEIPSFNHRANTRCKRWAGLQKVSSKTLRKSCASITSWRKQLRKLNMTSSRSRNHLRSIWLSLRSPKACLNKARSCRAPKIRGEQPRLTSFRPRQLHWCVWTLLGDWSQRDLKWTATKRTSIKRKQTKVESLTMYSKACNKCLWMFSPPWLTWMPWFISICSSLRIQGSLFTWSRARLLTLTTLFPWSIIAKSTEARIRKSS